MAFTLPRAAAGMSALADELVARGVLNDPAWRAAYWRVPRHLFVPPDVWAETERGDYAPLRFEAQTTAWWAAVYADQYIVTQVDDGDPAGRDGRGLVSSSSASQPSFVFRMLHALEVAGGMRVLEIGTGTGYNAGLLAARLGGDRVVTVEADPRLAADARSSLDRAGLRPGVVTGDGTAGYAPGAPYDRVLSTAAVRRVPWAWVAQTRPGGRIVTPWGTAFYNNALLRLSVAEDGTASGRVIGDAPFMWVRGQRVRPVRLRDVVHDEARAARSTTTIAPSAVYGDDDAAFAVGLLVPDCQRLVFDGPDGSGESTLWLLDAETRSWASVDEGPGTTTFPVEQLGPRRLWDEVAAAHRWWTAHDRPARNRWGVTVRPDGQHIWLDDPAHPADGAP